MIEKVTVNHAEPNYFGDYEEIRSDEMTFVTPEKVESAINKLVRRHKNGHDDCLFVINDDGTGWRLTYDYDPELTKRGVYTKHLRLLHYCHTSTNSSDSEDNVSVAYAIRAILEGCER